ncbi:hypothetical protein FQA39_LY10644 [Lamprigera yunnana]|nr:hypothetical protein FQA39_LY10644 [Lamprigera yunnana]
MCIRNVAQQSLEAIEEVHYPIEIKKSEELGRTRSKGVERDLLALSTHKLRLTLLRLDRTYKTFENSKFFRILTGTTQPAHLLTLLAAVTISCLIYSEEIECKRQPSTILNLLYLGSVSAHFGTQLWMSFVSGLTLYFTLPRRLFGKVQKALFPKYFLVNAILSLISLSTFLKRNTGHLVLPQIRFQVETLILCFSIELFVRLYLTPPLLDFMSKANEYEEKAGVGMEIGRHQPGVLTNNKEYVQVYKSFRKLHMAIAIGNIVTLACSIVHIHYLSNKLNFI